MTREAQELEGTVLEILPNSMVRLKVSHGAEVTAHVATGAKSEIVRVLPGDKVRVELSPYDPGRGRIVGVSKGAKQ